jgi:hypothetical protein
VASRRLRLDSSLLSRRALLAGLATSLLSGQSALAFGRSGAFHPRVLVTGKRGLGGLRASAPGRWSWELIRRTSAPGRLTHAQVSADQPELLAEPFVLWAGASEVPALSGPELRGLQCFLRLGGMLVVDDSDPGSGAFGRSVRRELARVLPESPVVRLDPDHVLFRTFYIIDRPVGRVLGTPQLDAISRGQTAQIIVLAHDLLGALARTRGGSWALEVTPGGFRQREYAIRLAVNIAMYLLCSDYKNDQVHAPWLMRRRARRHP